MKATYGLFLVLAMGLASILGAPQPDTSEFEVISGNNLFTQAMYNAISSRKEQGNIFFSPLSAHALLSMAYQGAGDHTLEAFANILHVSTPEQAANGYDAIIQSLEGVSNVTLDIANKIYGRNGHAMKDTFEEAVTKKFHSEIQIVDFSNQAQVAEEVNSWVKEKTHDKITELLKGDDVDPETRLVLVNVIYFKGNWAEQFKKENTRTEPFYVDDGTEIDVQMMHATRKFHFKFDSELDAKILELKYKNDDFSMVVILPNEKNGISDLETKLATKDLGSIADNVGEYRIQVSLPKFKIEETIDLKDILTEMGLGEIFDERCNLKEMLANGEDLYVDKAMQKAYIEVNEEGAEIAAASALTPVPSSLPPRFRADHPFIVLIKMVKNGESLILFEGKVVEPKSGDSEVAPRGNPDQFYF